jgi:hypothetical protein
MVWRKVLAVLLVAVAASPAWGAAEPLGSITTASATTIRDTSLTAGSTVFSGDVISVAAGGATRIALKGGAQVEVLGNSSVRLSGTDGKTQMSVDRGQATFHSSGTGGISALVADATVRPVDGSESSAVIQSLSQTHSVIAAEKGALLITTAHDGKSFTIAEGQLADLTAVESPAAPDDQKKGAPAPGGQSAPAINPPSKTVVLWTVAILTIGVGVAAYVLLHNQAQIPAKTLQNEISPYGL